MYGGGRKRQRLDDSALYDGSVSKGNQGDDIVGTDLTAAHPYGARPAGNELLAPPSLAATRSRGLGASFGRLSDEALLHLLGDGLGDARLLGRLVCCSRALYVFGHQTELWRNLALKVCDGGGGAGSGGVAFDTSWKDTCVRLIWRTAQNAKSNNQASQRKAEHAGRAKATTAVPTVGVAVAERLPPLHTPLRVAGIYSDALFRPWCCAAMRLQPRWLTPCNVPRRAALSVPDFVAQVRPPVIHPLAACDHLS